MVRIKADMIVNPINHHINYYFIDHNHIIHHQGIICNILNLLNIFTRRNHPSISTMIVKKMDLSMGGDIDSLILTLIREVSFLTIIGEIPNSIRDQGGGYANFGEFFNSISSFDESHDVDSTLLWIGKVDNMFDMEYIPTEDHIEFVVHKLKGRTLA